MLVAVRRYSRSGTLSREMKMQSSRETEGKRWNWISFFQQQGRNCMHSADSEPCQEAGFRVSQSSSLLGSVMAAVEQQRRHDSSGLPVQGGQ